MTHIGLYGRFTTKFTRDDGNTYRAVWWQAGKRILRQRYYVIGWRTP